MLEQCLVMGFTMSSPLLAAWCLGAEGRPFFPLDHRKSSIACISGGPQGPWTRVINAYGSNGCFLQLGDFSCVDCNYSINFFSKSSASGATSWLPTKGPRWPLPLTVKTQDNQSHIHSILHFFHAFSSTFTLFHIEWWNKDTNFNWLK